ncbi:hypothetical protein MNQ98_21305 [Paenibacillus sp. N3/727]|uniref:hypothetical protein n=1 Tax=Paenibacillus sp. N3/727 TaxID=2925845 RepID=UPI001F5398AA|nr:hypothetical protein [Paenibacillus sp. N3/727]UNK17005.1 hypothetical protein MNQ98_21305 [Paenibacillus sp. N3/727]
MRNQCKDILNVITRSHTFFFRVRFCDYFKDQLGGFAEGFLDGYVQEDQDKVYSVMVEEFLMLFDLTYNHINLLNREFNEGLVLRVGNRSAVEERIPGYIRKLEEYTIK